MKKSDDEHEQLLLVIQQLKAEIRALQEDNRQLKENQQFLYNILASAPIVIWSIDLEGTFTYSQYQKGTGLPYSENIGKSVFDVYKGTNAEIFVKRVLQGEILVDVIDLNGISYDTRVSPIYNHNGIKTGYMGVSLDITEQLKVKKELEKFRHVLDQAPGAVMIMDKDFNFEYINPHFTRISGYTQEELLHRNISETLYGGKIPDSRKGISESMASGQTWQGELPTRNKDGSWYWANTVAAPFLDKNGCVDGFVIIQQDITQSKQMQLEMEEKEKLYRSLMEKSLDGIVISQDGKVVMVNKAFADMLGYTVEECMESFGPESIAPEDRQRVLEVHYRRMKGELGDLRYSATIIGKNGTRVIAEFNTTSIEINGRPASLVTTHDITHRLRSEEELRKAKAELEALNRNLEERVKESTLKLTEANT
jgi:PAS domain S-box-containing protein